MEKEIVKVASKNMNNSDVKIDFKDYTYIIDKTDLSELDVTDNEDDMLGIFLGIFIWNKYFLKFIPTSIMIYICNFRDKINVSLVLIRIMKLYIHQEEVELLRKPHALR